ncbi:Hsp70 protein-domain-containing protein [Elsinoe ampelina]|uniref:Hsp70 protein-domain-containing protein n=1 Tax=Elsinoe ampelina TaxID=302913 RepID=A0A6A6G9S3_9PEZI|nr:Hsp70 protein-domain-containing protein [Elsinoe ampelina]
MAGRNLNRRSTIPALHLLIPLALLLFASTASAASAVLGIDFGTNFIKAAIVRPGAPIDIVLTKDSKRKETAALAFKPNKKGPVELGSFPERAYGGDALALAGRFPGDVYSNLKPLLGIDPSADPVVSEYTSRFPALSLETKQKLSVAFKSGAFSDKEQPWTVEELLAMELKNIRTNAEVTVGKGSRVTDTVITVPVFYTADERKAIERAAQLAGLSVLGLMSDGLAVGQDYSIKREFPNVSRGGKAELHLVFDMGATSTKATVLRFQSRDVKDVGSFNKTIREVDVLGAGWDRTLGGNALNAIVLDHLVSEFTKKSEVSSAGISAADVKKHGRTASKLWREAERARQVLSANTDVRSSFEGLYQDIDFASKLSRTQFEELTVSFADRVEIPIKQALEAAKITIDDLTSVILHGGATRTPFVQKKLESIIGKAAEIRSNVNADESAAFGAAYKAADLSPSFSVKGFKTSEAAVYAAGISQTQSGKERQQQIFIPTSKNGVPKQVSFKDREDFTFGIYQKVEDVPRMIASIETKNVTDNLKKLRDEFGCNTDEASVKFLLRLNPVDNIPEVESGIVQCIVKDTPKGGIVDSVKGLFGGKKDDQKPLKDGEESKSSSESASSTASSPTASASGKENKTASANEPPSLKIQSFEIKYEVKHAGIPIPAKEETSRMAERLAAFDRSDRARLAREEAFNVLEGFTYRARDLLDDAGFAEFSTEAVRTQVSDLLSSTGDWLYGEGATATTDVLKGKLAEFKKLIDPVKKRQEEAKGRPEKVKLLQQVLDQTKGLIDNMSSEIEKAAASASSLAEQAASSVSSAVTPESSTKDDLDDLEEPGSSTSTTSSAKAEPSLFNPYTKEDLASLTEAYESVQQWLKEKTSAQEKLKPYDDVVLAIQDLERKGAEMQQAMTDLIRKKIKMPPRKKTSSKKSKPKAKKGKSSSSSTTAAAAASDAPEPKTIKLPEGGKAATEEELMEAIRQAAGDAEPPAPEPTPRDEL